MAPPRSLGARAKLALAIALVAAAGLEGCAWVRWRSLALTHVDLMERLALDGAESLAAPGRGLEPGDIERLRYPLLRARDFARTSHRRFEGDAWVVEFDGLLSAYAELVDYLDRARTRHVGRRAKERAHELARKVAVAAGEVRRELGESGGDDRPAVTSGLSPSRPESVPGRCRSAGA